MSLYRNEGIDYGHIPAGVELVWSGLSRDRLETTFKSAFSGLQFPNKFSDREINRMSDGFLYKILAGKSDGINVYFRRYTQEQADTVQEGSQRAGVITASMDYDYLDDEAARVDRKAELSARRDPAIKIAILGIPQTEISNTRPDPQAENRHILFPPIFNGGKQKVHKGILNEREVKKQRESERMEKARRALVLTAISEKKEPVFSIKEGKSLAFSFLMDGTVIRIDYGRENDGSDGKVTYKWFVMKRGDNDKLILYSYDKDSPDPLDGIRHANEMELDILGQVSGLADFIALKKYFVLPSEREYRRRRIFLWYRRIVYAGDINFKIKSLNIMRGGYRSN